MHAQLAQTVAVTHDSALHITPNAAYLGQVTDACYLYISKGFAKYR